MFLVKPRKKLSKAKLLGAVQINNTSFFVCKNNEGEVCLKTGKEEKLQKSILQRMIDLNPSIKKILSEREYTILCLRYALKGGIPLPQREVANVLKISRSYISRIEKHAIEKLRNRLSLEDFLD